MLSTKKRIAFAGIAVLFIAGSSLFAQAASSKEASSLEAAFSATASPKRNVFVILDVSGSMTEQDRFTNVQDYLETEVINSFLRDGDDFTLVTFGEEVRERFTRTIHSGADRESLKTELRRISPDENYTDIGMAMEKLAEILEKQEKSGIRQVVLFITDGLNIPSPGSKYQGVDLSVDEGFKSLGEKISRGSWFLYVIGIGGETAAGDVASLIPGSQLQTTGSDLSGVDIASRITQLERKEQQRLEEEQAKQEAERLAAESASVGIFQRLKNALGLPVFVSGLALVLLAAIIPLILLIVILARLFKIKELVITDGKESLVKRVPVMGRVMLNSPAFALSGIGGENNSVFCIERGLLGFKLQTLDSRAMAEGSPYQRTGIHSFKGGGTVGLANGSMVRITVR